MFGTRPSKAELLLLAVLVFQLVTAVLALGNRNDLDIFLAASRDLLAGGDIYRTLYNQDYAYFYSLAFALLVVPLTWVPVVVAKLLWSLAMLAAGWRCLVITGHWLGLDRLPLQRRRLIEGLAALMLLQAVRDNLNAGQTTLLLCWIGLEGIRLAQHDRPVPAALLLAFGIDLKLLPLVVVPYLVYRAQWRTLAWLPVWLAVWVLAPLPLVPNGQGTALLQERWQLIDPGGARHTLDNEEPDFIAFGGLFSAYLGQPHSNDHPVDLPRTLAVAPPAVIGALVWTARALMALGMWWCLGRPVFAAPVDEVHRAREVAFLMGSVCLVFPHQQHYSMFLLAPAVLYLCAGELARPRPRTWALVLLALGLNAYLVAGTFLEVFDHYKLFSWTALAVLAWTAFGAVPRARSLANAGREAA